MALQRHPGLVPLSHQHHSLLILAQAVKEKAPAYKGVPTDTKGKVGFVIAHQPLFESHTRAEDDILFPFLKEKGLLNNLTSALQSQHRLIDAAMHQLQIETDESALRAIMDSLGFLMEAHIRKEERELFPAIQEAVDNDTLHALGHKLLEAMHYEGLEA